MSVFSVWEITVSCIWLDPDLLAIRGITADDVLAAIQSQNIQVAAGSVGAEPLQHKEAYQYTLETQGLLVNEEEFGNIIIKAFPDGKYLRMRDIADIEIGRRNIQYYRPIKRRIL